MKINYSYPITSKYTRVYINDLSKQHQQHIKSTRAEN